MPGGLQARFCHSFLVSWNIICALTRASCCGDISCVYCINSLFLTYCHDFLLLIFERKAPGEFPRAYRPSIDKPAWAEKYVTALLVMIFLNYFITFSLLFSDIMIECSWTRSLKQKPSVWQTHCANRSRWLLRSWINISNKKCVLLIDAPSYFMIYIIKPRCTYRVAPKLAPFCTP